MSTWQFSNVCNIFNGSSQSQLPIFSNDFGNYQFQQCGIAYSVSADMVAVFGSGGMAIIPDSSRLSIDESSWHAVHNANQAQYAWQGTCFTPPNNVLDTYTHGAFESRPSPRMENLLTSGHSPAKRNLAAEVQSNASEKAVSSAIRSPPTNPPPPTRRASILKRRDSATGRQVGVGCILEPHGDDLIVSAVKPGGSAAMGGLAPGTVLLAVESRSTAKAGIVSAAWWWVTQALPYP